MAPSNVGKSSALNAITGINALARTSKSPGRTQHLNFFRIDEQRRFVDLPGYGYAKVPAEMKRKWERLIERYLQERQSLRGVILVMDIRHPLTEFDRQMLGWCRQVDMPVHLLLTKADKLSRGAASAVVQQVKKALQSEFSVSLSQNCHDAVSLQTFSAAKKTGIEQVHAVLDQWLGYESGAEIDKKNPGSS